MKQGSLNPFFVGDVRTVWMIESGADTCMKLDSDILFSDSFGDEWIAPAGLIFDGASIPRLFWPIIGSPFTGDYRRAAVLHDAAYKNGWHFRDEADLMFYEAMRADGLRPAKALIMYWAVRLFGWFAWKKKGER